ncbi:hypothetical protein [Kineothrix sp. MB12-C1]|uniref:hypothetical protein n=1 Tax=Kineothrix sp. MB12-C1 TaxID=3070215 RepID=UPI0027D20968|nr:hypothetical protein [Kineothrix sp. MB12-C1]WMC93229.1 hypothetical protein RBB56_02800 [Kineothrix sp. MB12-C1]
MINKDKQRKRKRSKQLNKSLIAYFDILGYKEMVKTKHISENELIEMIEEITQEVYRTKKFERKSLTKWNVYSFSDNFAICVNYPKEGLIEQLRELIWILTILQCQFLTIYGVLIRGSIVNGMVYTGNKFIYGEGLIRAYEIENSCAIYPRIIVDAELINECLECTLNITQNPVSLHGKIYDPADVNEFNMFQLNPQLLFGSLYDKGIVDNSEIDIWISKEKDFDLVTICKDFDNEYYIDSFRYFLYLNRYPNQFQDENSIKDDSEESVLELLIQGLWFQLSRYLREFGKDNKLLKKYLWICNKANIILKEIGYHNLINKYDILESCGLDLNNIYTDDNILNTFIKDIPDN